MTAFNKRVTIAKMYQGIELYSVFSVTGVRASVGKQSFLIDLYLSRYTDAPFMRTTRGEWSLLDINALNKEHNGYNFHAVFATKADADEYASEINSNSLPPDLKEVAIKLSKEKLVDWYMNPFF